MVYSSTSMVPACGAAAHTVRRYTTRSPTLTRTFREPSPEHKINFNNNTAFGNGANFNLLADSGYRTSHVKPPQQHPLDARRDDLQQERR